jgi:hypothetical protein
LRGCSQRLQSLRRHYPDQVLRVRSSLLPSQPEKQAPRVLISTLYHQKSSSRRLVSFSGSGLPRRGILVKTKTPGMIAGRTSRRVCPACPRRIPGCQKRRQPQNHTPQGAAQNIRPGCPGSPKRLKSGSAAYPRMMRYRQPIS